MRVQQLRVQARSAEEMALRTRSAAQACPSSLQMPLCLLQLTNLLHCMLPASLRQSTPPSLGS